MWTDSEAPNREREMELWVKVSWTLREERGIGCHFKPVFYCRSTRTQSTAAGQTESQSPIILMQTPSLHPLNNALSYFTLMRGEERKRENCRTDAEREKGARDGKQAWNRRITRAVRSDKIRTLRLLMAITVWGSVFGHSSVSDGAGISVQISF